MTEIGQRAIKTGRNQPPPRVSHWQAAASVL